MRAGPACGADVIRGTRREVIRRVRPCVRGRCAQKDRRSGRDRNHRVPPCSIAAECPRGSGQRYARSTDDQLQKAPHEPRRQVSSPPCLKRTMPDSPREQSEQIVEPDDPLPGTVTRVDAESSQNQP